MKGLLIIVVLTFALGKSLFATEQIPDLLIIGDDTVCLKSFPLDKLEFKKSPFKYGDHGFPHTACWRGYQATWEIIDNKLFLVEITKVDSTQEKINLKKYFKENGYEPKLVDGKIFAEWYSAIFENYFVEYVKDCIYESYDPKKGRERLVFEKGLLTFDDLKTEK